MAAENVPFEEGPKWWEADDDSQDGQVEEQAIGLMDKPMYENRKSLKREVNRVKDILLNVAMKKTIPTFYFNWCPTMLEQFHDRLTTALGFCCNQDTPIKLN